MTISEAEDRQTTEKMKKAKNLFFEKTNKIDYLLARLIQRKREKGKTQNQEWKGDIITDPTDNKMMIREYYEQLYVSKFEDLNEIDKFLTRYTYQI